MFKNLKEVKIIDDLKKINLNNHHFCFCIGNKNYHKRELLSIDNNNCSATAFESHLIFLIKQFNQLRVITQFKYTKVAGRFSHITTGVRKSGVGISWYIDIFN